MSSFKSTRKACKLYLSSKAGCPNGDECNYSHDPIFIKKHTKGCSVSGCNLRLSKDAAGTVCFDHARASKVVYVKTVKPCIFQFSSAKGCVKGDTCPFSHERSIVQAALIKDGQGDLVKNCANYPDCELFAEMKYCKTCAQQYRYGIEERKVQDHASKPCRWAYRSEQGCRREDCNFSHDYELCKEVYNLHTCESSTDDAPCDILCAEGFQRCNKHHHEYKEERQASFLQERQEKYLAQRQEELEKRELRDCAGPNCMNLKHKSQVKFGFCVENGCQELMDSYTPKDITLIHFGRAKNPEAVFAAPEVVEQEKEEVQVQEEATPSKSEE